MTMMMLAVDVFKGTWVTTSRCACYPKLGNCFKVRRVPSFECFSLFLFFSEKKQQALHFSRKVNDVQSEQPLFFFSVTVQKFCSCDHARLMRIRIFPLYTLFTKEGGNFPQKKFSQTMHPVFSAPLLAFEKKVRRANSR